MVKYVCQRGGEKEAGIGFIPFEAAFAQCDGAYQVESSFCGGWNVVRDLAVLLVGGAFFLYHGFCAQVRN